MEYVSTSPSLADQPMDGRDALLTLTNAQKRYGSSSIFEIEEFSVFRGDRIELIGANSSGKSTLARVMAGYARLSSGTWSRSPELHTAPVGFLPQSGGLFRDLTLIQNVVAIARLLGRKGEVNAHSERVLFDLDLTAYLDRKASTLSGGIQRLGAMAALIAARPFGLILDEPFAGLDESKTNAVASLLNDPHYTFEFILLTGHGRRNIFEYGRCIRIESGQIEDCTNLQGNET
ncbi:MAG: ATP-binding cassette domain-containing protein [Hyphomonas sp.]